jgi:hypothetical protein
MLIAVIVAAAALSAGASATAPVAAKDALGASALNAIKSQFGRLMDMANQHDIKAIRSMFWQSSSALLVAKSAIPAEGNWAGFWGNDEIDQKLHDIAASGPVVLTPDQSKLRVVGLIPASVTIIPEKECPTRTVGPSCRASTRSTAATASESVVRGLWARRRSR